MATTASKPEFCLCGERWAGTCRVADGGKPHPSSPHDCGIPVDFAFCRWSYDSIGYMRLFAVCLVTRWRALFVYDWDGLCYSRCDQQICVSCVGRRWQRAILVTQWAISRARGTTHATA